MRYTVVVGNIGRVHETDSIHEGKAVFRQYVSDSQTGNGRAGGEDVTLFDGERIIKEYRPVPKLPPIGELVSLIKSLKKDIGDDYRATDDPDDDKPGMCVTIGWTPTGEWSYQTGDNSFTGGAYGHPHWAVVYINRRSNSREVVREIHDQLMDLVCQ